MHDSNLDCAITALGWVFDIFLVVVNLADVTSDVLIAVQFWVDDHTLFFGLVIASLLIANVIYAGAGVELVKEVWPHVIDSVPRFVIFLIIFPIAQAVPVLSWLLAQLKPKQQTPGVAEARRWQLFFAREEKDFVAATRDEVEVVTTSGKVMERLDIALAQHLRSHALFYVETIVEAIPQAVVQLLAVSFLGDATPLQVFSLALSMVSIISKGYVLSRAFGIPEMAFKFFVGAHDLFSLFYIFATVISSTSSKDVHVAGDLYIDYMSAVWVLKILITWGYVIVAALSVLIVGCVYGSVRPQLQRCDNVVATVGLCVVGLLLFVPLVVVLEGATLLWTVVGIALWEPQVSLNPNMALWYHFVGRGTTSEDKNERFRHICLRYLCDAFPPPAATSTVGKPLNESTVSCRRSMLLVPRDQDVDYVNQYFASMDGDIAQHAVLLLKRRFSQSLLFRHRFSSQFSSARSQGPTSVEGRFATWMLFIGMLLYAVGQAFNLVFPFVHFTLCHVSNVRISLLQTFCFYATASVSAVLLALTPRIWRYFTFLVSTEFVSKRTPPFLTGADPARPHLLKRYIEDYFVPPVEHFIVDSVPPSLLPLDALLVVAEFLSRDHLNLVSLEADDCTAIRRRVGNAVELANAPDEFMSDVVGIEVEQGNPLGDLRLPRMESDRNAM